MNKVYIVIDETFDGEDCWGCDYSICFASLEKEKCLEFVRKDKKHRFSPEEDYVTEIDLDKECDVYVGGYCE